MRNFIIVSAFGPSGDQPRAVVRLVEGLERGYMIKESPLSL